MVIVDEKNAYETCQEAKFEYSKGAFNERQLTAWNHSHEFKKGQWSIADYNYKEPAKKIYANNKTTSKFTKNGKYEHYEYGLLSSFTESDSFVKKRLEADESEISQVLAKGNYSTLYAGSQFKADKHENADEKGDYIATTVFHRAYDTTYFSGESGETGYENEFVCVPSNVHIRPEQAHKKPLMRGPQSAIVTGPSGEEIYVDDLGRIKVQFYWDRDGKLDENTSCYIRVVQPWAGAQWGAMFIPRIGQEVIVSFLDGDPDRPFISGTVYNGKNKPPFDSKNKTKSGFRTRSTKQGTSANANELIFDDRKDAEQIFIHAEKNFDTEVENDQSLTVDNDRLKHVKHNETVTVDNDRKKSVGNDESETVGNNKTISIGNNRDESIGKDLTISVADNSAESFGKNLSITVGKDNLVNIGGSHKESVEKDYQLDAKSITLQAKDQIVLKTGSAQIVMKKNGDITLSGKNINVKGSGNVVLKGSKVTSN